MSFWLVSLPNLIPLDSTRFRRNDRNPAGISGASIRAPLRGAQLSSGGGGCRLWAPRCCSGVAGCRLWAACRHLWVVGSFVGGGFVCGCCRSFVGGGLMFVGGGLMFVGDERLVGGGCRSGVGGWLFVVLSSCCVVRVVAVRMGWETEGYSPERPRR